MPFCAAAAGGVVAGALRMEGCAAVGSLSVGLVWGVCCMAPVCSGTERAVGT